MISCVHKILSYVPKILKMQKKKKELSGPKKPCNLTFCKISTFTLDTSSAFYKTYILLNRQNLNAGLLLITEYFYVLNIKKNQRAREVQSCPRELRDRINSADASMAGVSFFGNPGGKNVLLGPDSRKLADSVSN